MPNLPLPPETTIAGGDLPVSDETEVLAEFPTSHKIVEVAPVRDAFAKAYAAGFVEYQSSAEQTAAQNDPLRATGIYLKSYAQEKKVVPRPGESEESVRARLFTAPDIVTPDNIERAINDTIAPYTCELYELELDGMFVLSEASAPTASWFGSYIGAPADYPDRPWGWVLPTATPSNGLPRSFHVRLPALAASDNFIPFVGDEAGPFVGADAYVFTDPRNAEELIETVVSRVQAIKGQGISWSLTGDIEDQ